MFHAIRRRVRFRNLRSFLLNPDRPYQLPRVHARKRLCPGGHLEAYNAEASEVKDESMSVGVCIGKNGVTWPDQYYLQVCLCTCMDL